jgi:hypothetical protein
MKPEPPKAPANGNGRSGGMLGIGRSVVDSLKDQPVLIALIVLNIAWGVYLWRVDERRAEGTRLLFTEIMKLCEAVRRTP